MKKVMIYTDGACSGNPGPGGWGALIIYGDVLKELSGGAPETTNNRIELTAVIAALSVLKEPCEAMLYSDSKYIVDALRLGWAKSWQKNKWIKSDKKPALNADLWERLLGLGEIHKITPVWVRGHSGHQYNERCDRLAVAEAEKYKKSNKDRENIFL